MNKPISKKIKDYLEDGLTIRDISKVVGCSTSTVQKVKNIIDYVSI
ncbi:helix-turn-helix domain-containing protein [Gracilimonas sp. Q87]